MNPPPTAGPPPDDVALMEAIAARDPSALGTLYDRFSGMVFALCLRVLRDRMAAEDVLGDVFWEVWERAERFDPERGTVATYVATVARSRALDRLRSRRRREKVVVPGEVPAEPTAGPHGADTPFEDAVASEQRTRVQRALEVLHPDQRRAVELSFFDGFTHGEIARQLGEPLGTVKTRIRQGLIRLRDSLRKLYGEETA